jgi:hypothetical protein
LIFLSGSLYFARIVPNKYLPEKNEIGRNISDFFQDFIRLTHSESPKSGAILKNVSFNPHFSILFAKYLEKCPIFPHKFKIE